MTQNAATMANQLKQKSGQELKTSLTELFTSLVDSKIIKDFKQQQNFSHIGYSYHYQYKANYILETWDNKLIIINSSNSFRQDRVKQDLYDFEGITKNADISDKIIASILLFPDIESNNKSLTTFIQRIKNKDAYCPATHVFLISELVEFLDNHKQYVETVLEANKGSYFGKRGNAYEQEVVDILNNDKNLTKLKSNALPNHKEYAQIIRTLAKDCGIHLKDIFKVTATDTITKLKNGGNAKTDVLVTILTNTCKVKKTISIKNSTQLRVSCHDYPAKDFIRVLNIANTRTAEYLEFFQQAGSLKEFRKILPNSFSEQEFEMLMFPHREKLIYWCLTGAHDEDRLIAPETQVSEYLLINNSTKIKFISFNDYIDELSKSQKSTFGVPLSWTYPSKKRGERIQLKMPIKI